MTAKTVVITGASSGIGLETARALSGQGAMITAPSGRARDDASAKKLWALSGQLCGVTWS